MEKIANILSKNPMKLFILACIILFTITSCFGCVEVRHVSLRNADYIDGVFEQTSWTINNVIGLMLPLGILQIICILRDTKAALWFSLFVSLFTLLLTASHAYLFNTVENLFSDIYYSTITEGSSFGHAIYTTTQLGYLAIFFAAINTLSQIVSLYQKKQHTKSDNISLQH